MTIKTKAGLKICQNNQQNVANTFMTFLYPKTFKTTLKSQQIWYQIEAPFFGSYFKYTKRFLFHQNSSQASKNKCPGSTQFLPIRPWGLNTAETKNIGVVQKPTKNPQCDWQIEVFFLVRDDARMVCGAVLPLMAMSSKQVCKSQVILGSPVSHIVSPPTKQKQIPCCSS